MTVCYCGPENSERLDFVVKTRSKALCSAHTTQKRENLVHSSKWTRNRTVVISVTVCATLSWERRFAAISSAWLQWVDRNALLLHCGSTEAVDPRKGVFMRGREKRATEKMTK